MSELWLLFLLFVGVLYSFILLWLTLGVLRLNVFKPENISPKNGFSIIVAFRNEEENLWALLQSIAKQNYPKQVFEVLLVNDASTDQSTRVIQEFILTHQHVNIRLVENKRTSISPKKDAINTAIAISKYNWILTTDADCTVATNWLNTFNAYLTKNDVVFVAGLVSYTKKKGFLHQFQQIDWTSLIGVTLGSFGWNKPLLCSGANLGYKKKAFFQVKGFQGNEHIASGDDVFLMQKIQESFPNKLGYLNSKQALVKTQSIDSWQELYQQRIRWSKKTSSLPNILIKGIGMSVLLVNFTIIILFFFGFFDSLQWKIGFVFLAVKILLDSLLVYLTGKSTNQKIPIFTWLLSSLLYPIFSVSVILLGSFSRYQWKGRRFDK